MPSSTGYRRTPQGLTIPDSGLPSVGQAAFTGIWAYGHYDFAVQGGAVGAISLLGVVRIPAKSLVVGGRIRVTTPLTGGAGATAALATMSANDLVSATVVSGAPWSTTGTKAVIPVNTAATDIFISSQADITLTVAVNALTAGVFDVYLHYIPVLA